VACANAPLFDDPGCPFQIVLVPLTLVPASKTAYVPVGTTPELFVRVVRFRLKVTPTVPVGVLSFISMVVVV
jgi:hypothetical protein